MSSITITVPAYIEAEINDLATSIGVTADALAAYFFANEVVHTSSAKPTPENNLF